MHDMNESATDPGAMTDEERERYPALASLGRPTATVYISIGNSDNKLSQEDWSCYAQEVDFDIRNEAATVHGEWYSLPNANWQNACWCIEIPEDRIDGLKSELRFRASQYEQESIAWAPANTEFLTPKELS